MWGEDYLALSKETFISVTLLGSPCTLTCIYLNSNQAAQGHKYNSNPAGRLSFEHLWFQNGGCQ